MKGKFVKEDVLSPCPNMTNSLLSQVTFWHWVNIMVRDSNIAMILIYHDEQYQHDY